MASQVFTAVATECRHKRCYSADLHIRVDDLVQQWLDTEHGRRKIATGATEAHFRADVDDCTEYVLDQYGARYGHNAFGMPLIGVLLWPFVSALISLLVQRTLDQLFPMTGESGRAV